MYRSKLQISIEILCTLASSGSLKLTQLTHKVKLEKISLAAHLGFLYDRGLVGEGNLDEDERSYFVTERGLSVLKVVGPLIREAQRIEMLNFEKVSSVLSEAINARMKAKKPKRKWKLSDLIKIEIVKEE